VITAAEINFGVSSQALIKVQLNSQSMNERKALAFASICNAMSKVEEVYASPLLEEFREESSPDPKEVYEEVMKILAPSHADAKMSLLSQMMMLVPARDETMPQLLHRYAALVSMYPEEVTDETKILQINMAIQRNENLKAKFNAFMTNFFDQGQTSYIGAHAKT
jgi:hypothetical protein